MRMNGKGVHWIHKRAGRGHNGGSMGGLATEGAVLERTVAPAIRPERQVGTPWGPILLAAGVFAGLSLLGAIFSKGFLEADACTHYIYSRFCLQERHLLTNVWGRPFCTAIYAVPALIATRMGVRVMSLLLALGVAAITYRIARSQGYKRPVLAFLFVLAQPLVFLHSFSELTELPFAILMAAGFWAYQGRQWAWAALLVGMMPTARPEGFGFVVLMIGALVVHGRARWIPLLLTPLAVWSVAGWYQYEMPQPWLAKIVLWIPEHWPYAGESLYWRGPLVLWQRYENGEVATSFLLRLPAVVSPLVFPAVLVGGWQLAVGSWREIWRDHRRWCNLLIVMIPLMILAGHSFLYWRGKMASSGELRYMMVVTPFWALLGARGWEWVFERCQWRRPVLWAGVAALAPILANQVYRVVPIQLSVDWQRAEAVAGWVEGSAWKKDYPRFCGTHTSLYYFLDLSTSDRVRGAEWHRRTVLEPPEGVLLVWDPLYGMFNSDGNRVMKAEEIAAAGWVPVHVFSRKTKEGEGAVNRWAKAIQKDEVGDWIVFLSPKDRSGRETPREWRVALPTTRAAESDSNLKPE